jgi:hypothetical protein
MFQGERRGLEEEELSDCLLAILAQAIRGFPLSP